MTKNNNYVKKILTEVTGSSNLTYFLEQMNIGRVVADNHGNIILMNKTAKGLLKGAKKESLEELRRLIKMTIQYGNDLIEDLPNDFRTIRFQSQLLKTPDQAAFVVITISDVSEEAIEEREKEVFEHISSISAQSVPTTAWLQSLLNTVVILKKVNSASIMLYDSTENVLQTTISSSNIPQGTIRLPLGEGIAGLAALEKRPLVVLNTSKDKRYKRQIGKGEKASSILAVPMFVGLKLIGVLIIRQLANTYFREKDRAFYSILANRLAITLEYRYVLDQLRQQFTRLDMVINNSGEGMALLDCQGQIIIANPPLASLVGTTPEALAGKTLTQILPEINPLLDDKDPEIYKEIELTSLEEAPWVGAFVSHLKNGDSGNVVLTITDITADKQLEQIKNDFIATATHELRTPLTAILGYLSMMHHIDTNLEPKQKLYLDRINQASHNLSQLVEDLLSVLKIDQDAIQHTPDIHKLLPVVREIVKTLESKLIAKKIKVKLPEKDHKIFVDVNALQKVLVNLVDNAIKYSPAKSKITIKFEEITNHKNWIKVSIQDSGVGIPQSKQKRLFEKFYRVPNELSVEAGGTGLGLYITKKTVEAWGGEIHLADSSTKGSTFTFTIPKASKFTK